MNTYTIIPKTAWADVPEAEIAVPGKVSDQEIRAFFRICYDDTALYVKLRAEEKNIRATYTDAFGMPCEDSCLEFFFSPDSTRKTYFNIEMNPNCAMFLGIGEDGHHLIRLNPMSKLYDFGAETKRTDTGWELSYRIPYAFIRFFFPEFAPAPGDTMKANVYKCGDLCEKEHYLSWSPVDWTKTGGAFHNPDCFGTMVFG